MNEKKIIGRKDKADFPDLDLFNVNVKIDTGAYTGAIHCDKININEGNNNVQFNLFDSLNGGYQKKIYRFPIHKIKKVKSSSGEIEKRVFIKTKIILFNEISEIELSLTNRENMKFPVLIGRKFLRNNFIVEISKYNLSYKQKKKLRKIRKGK